MRERMQRLKAVKDHMEELADANQKFDNISARDLFNYLEELERWRKTGFAVMSEYTVKTDAMIENGDKEDMRKLLREFREAFRYSMLRGVAVHGKLSGIVKFTFPVEISVCKLKRERHDEDGFDAERENELSESVALYDGFDSAVSIITAFAQQLPENGLWSLFPEMSYLYNRVDSVFPYIERNHGIATGIVRVNFRKSVTGYDLAIIMNFLEKQMRLFVAPQIAKDEAEIPGGYVKLNLMPNNDLKLTPPPDFREDTDLSIMLRILNNPSYARKKTRVTRVDNSIVIDSPESGGEFTFHFDENENLV